MTALVSQAKTTGDARLAALDTLSDFRTGRINLGKMREAVAGIMEINTMLTDKFNETKGEPK